ncbi:MAG: GyrI-like domain-containing protein [Pirellulales bacterium]
MLRAKTLGLGTPRFERGREMLVAGLNRTYDMNTRVQIPQQWERFAGYFGKIPTQIGTTTFGVVWNNKPDCVFDYLTCAEVQDAAGLPTEFTRLTLPAGRFVVVTHSGPIAKYPETLAKIWTNWIPESGLFVDDRPCVEVYDERFDPRTGTGDVDLWIPLKD